MEIRKSVAYAFPSSPNAGKLGMSKIGAWHVSQYIKNEAGEWNPPFIPAGTEGMGFDTPDDLNLIQLFIELEGDVCPYFIKYGNEKAIRAIVEHHLKELQK